MKAIGISRRLLSALCIFTAALFVLSSALPASAQWTVSNTQHAWGGYNNAFLFTDADGTSKQFSYVYNDHPNTSGMWESAQQIQLAIDAYVWAETNDSANKATYLAEVTALCDGYVKYQTKSALGAGGLVGDNWASADDGNDDVLWAVLAFVRAYDVTGTTRWLTDAENNFNAVWSRGYDTTWGGGIWWDANHSTTGGGYKNSPSNWTFVEAGYLIDSACGHCGNYKSEADTIYTWAKSYLYVSSTGEVCDGYKASGCQTGEYSYNYGSAIDAATEEADSTAITNMANFAMTGLGNYVTVIGGYNILPNYGTGYVSGGGFNGILLRAIGHANVHGNINSTVLAWARANVTQAWAMRDADELAWDNWNSTTPVEGSSTYSWDCTDLDAGMFDIPIS